MAEHWTTRFAPSPTGRLHLGHACAAVLAHKRARESEGMFLLRHEDLDSTRCRPGFTAAIEEDLAWLGIRWDAPPVAQSTRLPVYLDALARLEAMGVVYPCFCTRRDIQDEITRMGGAPQGPDGPLYPGTCRKYLNPAESMPAPNPGCPPALRLDVARACQITGPMEWTDRRHGKFTATPECLGDVVLGRRDIGVSYHLAVVVDDAWQGVNLVTRGEDLLPSTHIHRLLQALLDLPVPTWEHHPLVLDEQGRRLAKRHDSLALATLRESGWTPGRVLAACGQEHFA